MSEEIKAAKGPVKTAREANPEAFKKLQAFRRHKRTSKRSAFEALGHKLGSKNKKCKRCNLLTTTEESLQKCAKSK